MNEPNPYALLFEPIKIGPVQSKNRFYQVPHATGMGNLYPNHSLRFREVKAEGGWGVVCGEECMIHPTSDHMPSPSLRLYSDKDIPFIARHAEQVHKHGALFGLELSHAGKSAANRLTREYPLGPGSIPYTGIGPYATRAMDRSDIGDLRRWHRDAARRAVTAGVDIVYVYCGHDLSVIMQFLLTRYNKRTDQYGGSLENRTRLLREILEDTMEIADGKAAVALRFAVEEKRGTDGISSTAEARDIIESLANIPDLWDVNLSDWSNDSGPSRFFEEGYQENFTAFVKGITDKPVVGVGRYTSPDRMLSLIKRGVQDFIGAARPSIADPFLPDKIKNNRVEDIRECIGCNICTSNVSLAVPIRCTQNPTIGVEWSRNWHPEKVPAKSTDGAVLIIGAGPAGLEAGLTLARRGQAVYLAEADGELGGRVRRESRLPGLSAWSRVADYREYQLRQMANVEIYRGNRLNTEEVMELGIPHIVIATGGHWRKDGIGRINRRPVPGSDADFVYSADDILSGRLPRGRVVLFDDDHYYLGSAIAEQLVTAGCDVTLVTPAAEVGAWGKYTLEFPHIQRRMAEMGVGILPSHNIVTIDRGSITTAHIHTNEKTVMDADAVVMVTFCTPNDQLYRNLQERQSEWTDKGITSLARIGDCVAPGPIAQAVHDGHRFARHFGTTAENTHAIRFEPLPDVEE